MGRTRRNSILQTLSGYGSFKSVSLVWNARRRAHRDRGQVRWETFIDLFSPDLGIIILTSQLLSLGLARIRQPKVIAEVLGTIDHCTQCRPSPDSFYRRNIAWAHRVWSDSGVHGPHIPKRIKTLSLLGREHRSRSVLILGWTRDRCWGHKT